jgi:hypothetical protein
MRSQENDSNAKGIRVTEEYIVHILYILCTLEAMSLTPDCPLGDHGSMCFTRFMQTW